MSSLEVRLFGKFTVRNRERELEGFQSKPVQQLFSYLLIYRHQHHPRETLAGLLWDASSTAQSKKYLRQALWQLQSALDAHDLAPGLLDIDAEWVRLRPEAEFFLDVATFEAAFNTARGRHGHELEPSAVRALEDCVELYRGDLLKGWYQDWCIYERERLQNMYLAMLDKLTDACEAQGDFETGQAYAVRILRYDRARERTHRRLMRLFYLAGDRTGAIRQYERCVAALEEELAVAPAQRTKDLFDRIRNDEPLPIVVRQQATVSQASTPSLAAVFSRLQRLKDILFEVQRHAEQDMETIDRALTGEG